MRLSLPAHRPRPRSRRVVELLGALWLCAACDLWFTIWADRYTSFHELNPLARVLLSGRDHTSLIVFKFSLTLAGTLVLFKARGYARAECATWGVVAVYVLLMLRWSEYTVMATGA